MLAGGAGIFAVSTQWCLEGWYSNFCILSELLPAPCPNSCSSKMQILLVHLSPEFFSSSDVEKIYFCLLEREYEVTFLHQGHMAGSPPPWSLEILSAALSCHQGHLLQDGDSSSSSVLSDSTAEPAGPAPQKHHFHHCHHFLCLSGHLMFCLLSLWFGLCLSGAVVWQVGAQSWQPRRSTASDNLSLGLPARIWCWETGINLGSHPDFVICWSERELWKRLPASRAVWQILHCTGMLADWDIYFFSP